MWLGAEGANQVVVVPRQVGLTAVASGSLLDDQPGDLTLAEGEAEVEVGLRAGEVPFEVMGDVVVVRVDRGCTGHLDCVGLLAGRA